MRNARSFFTRFSLLFPPKKIPNIYVFSDLRSLKKYPNTTFTVTLQIISHLLAYSNSCVNPILYAFLSEPFRRGFCAVINCIRPAGPHNYNGAGPGAGQRNGGHELTNNRGGAASNNRGQTTTNKTAMAVHTNNDLGGHTTTTTLAPSGTGVATPGVQPVGGGRPALLSVSTTKNGSSLAASASVQPQQSAAEEKDPLLASQEQNASASATSTASAAAASIPNLSNNNKENGSSAA